MKPNEFVGKVEGKDTDLVKIGDSFYKKEDINPTTGQPKDGVSPATLDKDTQPVNKGENFVTSNKVADAIAKAGWNLGLATDKEAENAQKAFADESKALGDKEGEGNDKVERINPNDNVRFANGKNTKVSAATVESLDANGDKVTTTYVKTDVELPISQIEKRDANPDNASNPSKNLVEVDGKWYPKDQLDDNGKPKADAQPANLDDVKSQQNVVNLDPDNKGNPYNSIEAQQTAPNGEPDVKAELDAKIKEAQDKVTEILKDQPQSVIDAAKRAAEEEAKYNFYKAKNNNQEPTSKGGTVISNVGWGTVPSDAVNVDQLNQAGWFMNSTKVENTNGKVITANDNATKVKKDETLNINAGNNIEITRTGRDIAIAVSKTLEFDRVTIGGRQQPCRHRQPRHQRW